MIKHIVWWSLKEEAAGATAAENCEKMVAMLRALEGKIPSLDSIEVSTTFLGSTTEEPIQVILQSTHNDEESLKAYAVHPEHMKCVEFIKQIVATRKAIDYVI
ncbi:MAG: Dabb family protein [Halodesulfovibrio sp.]